MCASLQASANAGPDHCCRGYAQGEYHGRNKKLDASSQAITGQRFDAEVSDLSRIAISATLETNICSDESNATFRIREKIAAGGGQKK
jgi:hypothetical protein